MLRITIHDQPDFLTFQLEGKLDRSSVQALHDCWQGARGSSSRPGVQFDLRDVTYIDGAGKAFLAARHAQGAKLIASGCCMRAIVAEIAGRSIASRPVACQDALSESKI